MMDLVRAQEASSSSFIYDVFLSFRGADTRNTFVAHLYTALFGAGFRTFKDDDGIRRGENISSELEKAILKEARSSIIVFSKDYASSKWCLDELGMILQHNRTSGHKIFPVFYHVDPSDVRNQTGSFEEAFRGHEEQIEMEMDERIKEHLRNKLEGWRAALKQVGSLAGMVLADRGRDESKFIKDIVKKIAKNVYKRVLYVAPHPVGMESRAKNIISWLEDDSEDATILVIHGIGGIGKTTIAKYVYNLYFARFEGSSFLDVREKLRDMNGLIKIQKQLLSDIFGKEKEKINSVDEGIPRIGDAIGYKTVLLVIDNVDKRDQLKVIIKLRHRFHPGSKIILTTRNHDLFEAKERYKLHELNRLYDDESLELFSWHAFGQDYPVEHFRNHSKRVVEYCGGNPLALEVLASSLVNSSEEIWESTLQKLKTIQPSEILETLRISYDNLLDDNVQNLFLHIACFFIGKGKDFTVKILDACGIYTIVGMEILKKRSLLNFDGHNKLTMHQLIRDMGREIVRQESLYKGERGRLWHHQDSFEVLKHKTGTEKIVGLQLDMHVMEVGVRSRLWHHKDSFKVLKDKIGTEKIVGLHLDIHVMEEDKCFDRSFLARNTKRKRFEELGDNSSLVDQGNSWKRLCSALFSWLPINMTVRNSNQEELKVDAFESMRNLALLQLNYVKIKGRYKNFPKGLRWLCWHGFSLKSLPSDISLESLVALDLRYSNLKQLWKGTKMLKSLKILNLSYCHDVANSPDFSQFPNLEELKLKGCINLVALHESIGKLESLLLLNLKGCKNLRQLPMKIFQMKSLVVLIISGCSGLERFSLNLGEMESLREFLADGINQSSSSSPQSFHFSLTSLPRCLVTLNLANCNLSGDGIPGNLCTLSLLKKLDLSFNPIRSLPKLPMSLRRLTVDGCRSLEMLTNLPNYPTKLDLSCNYCEKIVEVRGSFKLAPIGNVDSKMVNALGLTELDSNRMLQVELKNELNAEVYKKTSVLQGLYECGIYSIFIHGNEIPSWFDRKSDGASSISFTIPSLPKLKIQGLSVCVAYYYKYEQKSRYLRCYNDFIMVNNETRDQTWVYTPAFSSCFSRDTIWLSDWKIATQLMEVGDKVNVWVERSMGRKVKEFGIRIVYENTPATCHQNENVDIDLSNYHIGKGEYFLRTDTWRRGKELLEYWSRKIGSKRANAGEEIEYNSDGDPIEDNYESDAEGEKIEYNSDGDPIEDNYEYIDMSTPMVYESLGIARSRKKVFRGCSVVIEEITDSENSAVKEGTKMEDFENQRHLRSKCE